LRTIAVVLGVLKGLFLDRPYNVDSAIEYYLKAAEGK